MLTVGKIMSRNILKVDANTSVTEAAKLMRDKRVGCLLIEQNRKLTGIITEADIVRKIVADSKNPVNTQVTAVMNSPIVTIDIEKSIIEANDLMDQGQIRHLAVAEEGRIVGIVSSRDIMHPQYMEAEEW